MVCLQDGTAVLKGYEYFCSVDDKLRLTVFSRPGSTCTIPAFFPFQFLTYFVPVHPPSFSDPQFIPMMQNELRVLTKATELGHAYVWRAFIPQPFTVAPNN